MIAQSRSENPYQHRIEMAYDHDFESKPAPVKILARDGKKLRKPEILEAVERLEGGAWKWKSSTGREVTSQADGYSLRGQKRWEKDE